MAVLAFFLSLTFVALGAVGVISPYRLLAFLRRFETPAGLYAAAIFRLVLGLALMLAAPASRAGHHLGSRHHHFHSGTRGSANRGRATPAPFRLVVPTNGRIHAGVGGTRAGPRPVHRLCRASLIASRKWPSDVHPNTHQGGCMASFRLKFPVPQYIHPDFD
jgi:hypothetical protein